MKKTDALVSSLGKHLKQMRKEKTLTLEQLSKKSGISRSMLSQIERGETNPTFGTLWNLSRALGVEMSELVEEFETNTANQVRIERLSAQNTPRLTNQQNNCTLTLLGPADLIGQFEWYELQIQPDASLKSQAHAKGSVEHLTVIEGQAEVLCGDQLQHLESGDTARYPVDVPHQITCTGDKPLRGFLIVIS